MCCWPRWQRTSRQREPVSKPLTGSAKALFPHLAKVVNSYCPGMAREPYHSHRYGAPLHTH